MIDYNKTYLHPETIYAYIKKKDWFERFENNLIKQKKHINTKELIYLLYKKHNCVSLISTAFIWCATPERFDYWNDISDKFEVYIKRNENILMSRFTKELATL